MNDIPHDLRDFFEHAPCAYQALDRDGRIESVNATWLEWLGYAREAIVGVRTFESLLAPDSVEVFRRGLPTPEQGGWVRDLPLSIVRADGSTFPVRLGANVARDASGAFVCVRCLFSDARGQQQAERDVEGARREMARANESKSAFLASMSHELRTPLNAILGFSDLLLRDRRAPLTERQEAQARQIVRAGERLLRLVDEVLDFARVDGNHSPISMESVAVGPVLEEVLESLGTIAARFDVRIEPSTLEEGETHVLADRSRLYQILQHFGANAAKYNRAGGTMRFVVASGSEGRVRVSLVDTGVGIAEEHHPRVFEAFHRFGQESGAIEGTGVGLALCRLLAGKMRGRVGFTSERDVGSTFYVELERTEAPVERVSSPSPQRRASGARGVDLTILYVEDNPPNRRLLAEALESFGGCRLLLAPNAELGIDLALTHVPDLILLDVNLPGMNGEEAVRVLRAREETKDGFIVALSANAMDDDLRRAREAGFDEYLTKPVRLSALEAIVNRARDRRARAVRGPGS